MQAGRFLGCGVDKLLGVHVSSILSLFLDINKLGLKKGLIKNNKLRNIVYEAFYNKQFYCLVNLSINYYSNTKKKKLIFIVKKVLWS